MAQGPRARYGPGGEIINKPSSIINVSRIIISSKIYSRPSDNTICGNVN